MVGATAKWLENRSTLCVCVAPNSALNGQDQSQIIFIRVHDQIADFFPQGRIAIFEMLLHNIVIAFVVHGCPWPYSNGCSVFCG